MESETWRVSYCKRCEVECIQCLTCKNKTCHGSYGTVGADPLTKLGGELCPDCHKAYKEHTRRYDNEEG
jgi:hypothetical protein